MSAHCKIPVEDRFMIVRRQLDELGYKQSLKIDCLPLAEQLLADLIHTTESLRRYKDLAQQALEKCNLLEQGSQPYISENARLVHECNDLHNKLLHLKEESQEYEKTFKKKLHAYEKEISDQKFLASQLTTRIEELQKESAAKTKKILEEKKFDALITVPAGGRKRSFTFRRPKMEIDTALSASAPSSHRSASRQDSSPPVDILKIVEKQAEALSQQLKTTREQQKEQAELCATLKQQVESRDKEIKRLQKMLDGGMPVTAVIREHELERISEHQEKINSLETQVKDATAKQHEAMVKALQVAKKYERLKREMIDMDKVACAINSEKSALNRKLIQTEDEFRIFRNQYQDLEEENRRIREQKGSGSDSYIKEKRQLQKKLEAAQTELKDMKRREQDLMMEIKTLTEGHSSRSKDSKDVTTKPQSRKTSVQSGVSSTHSAPQADDQHTVPKQIEDPWLGAEKSSTSQAQQDLTAQQMLLIQSLQSERDKLAAECQRLKGEIERLSTLNNPEEMRALLIERNREVAALQHIHSNTLQENHDLKLQITKINSESNLGSARTAIVAQLERERDSARANMRKLQEEIDSLRDQLRAAAIGSARPASGGSQSEERVRQLESERRDLLTSRSQIEGERQELLNAQNSHRGTISNLEQQLRSTEAELTRQKTQYLQLKSLNEQSEASLAGLKSEMVHIRQDLAEAQARLGELAGLQAEVTGLRAERNQLRSTVSQTDQDKDALLLQIDEKSERIASLQSELRAKETWISNAERTHAELRKKLESSEDASLASQQDARGLQREVERLRQEFDKASALREASQREIKRLQDDLAAALHDCRIAQRDLALSQRETEDVKQKLQDYVAEVERIEQLLTQKEEERNDLLDHFRSLSQEATELESHNHTLKSETTEAKRTLQATEGQVAHLEDQLATSKSLIFSYESQVVELTQHVNNLEAQLHQVKDHSQSLEKDLNAVRDLCMNLDNQKETLQDDLMDSKKKCTELEANCCHLQEELSTMHSQLSHEQGNKGALETVLERSREESLQQRLGNEELNTELQSLREQVQRLQQQQDRAELSQRQAAECSRQVEELRRQVTNEKFERARMSEESRRYTVQTRVVASSTYAEPTEALSSARTLTSSSEESTPRNPSTTSHVTLSTNVVSTSSAPSNTDPSRPNSSNVAWNLPTSKSVVSVEVQEAASESPSLSLQSLSPDSSD